MNMILFILSLIVGIFGIILISTVLKNKKAKEKDGIIIYGKMLGCKEILGTPTRYMAEVEFVVNDSVKKKKIITTDKNITKYMDHESIPLIYVKSNHKAYWMEEKSSENIVIIILLVSLCVFAFILAFIALL